MDEKQSDTENKEGKIPEETMIERLETYKAGGKFNSIGIPTMLVLGGILGIAAAFVVSLIWQVTGFYLMFLFPAGIGAAAGFGLALGIKAGKCRNVGISVVAGLVVGFVSYISMHYFDSQSYGATSLLSYLHAIAEEGYTILFILPVSGFFAWITWIIEVGIVILVAIGIAVGYSEKPFCEDCARWCKEKTFFTSANKFRTDVVAALYDKDLSRLKALVGGESSDRDRLTIALSYCDNCLQKGYLTVTSVAPKGKKDKKESTLISNAAIGARGLDTILQDFPSESK